MDTVLLIAAAWLLILVVWVALKVRQPKLSYPVPPEKANLAAQRGADQVGADDEGSAAA